MVSPYTEGLLHRLWMKVCLRGMRGRNVHRWLGRAYRVRDPWNMASEPEQVRFRETNRLILNAFPEVGSMLEIGSGAGHQSEYLARHCKSLHGIDVVEAAVTSARSRVPGATFSVGPLLEQPWCRDRHRFDLVVACEVLYYLDGLPDVLDAMSGLGRGCFVTYYERRAHQVEPFLRNIRGVETSSVQHGTKKWFAAWWRNRSEAE